MRLKLYVCAHADLEKIFPRSNVTNPILCLSGTGQHSRHRLNRHRHHRDDDGWDYLTAPAGQVIFGGITRM